MSQWCVLYYEIIKPTAVSHTAINLPNSPNLTKHPHLTSPQFVLSSPGFAFGYPLNAGVYPFTSPIVIDHTFLDDDFYSFLALSNLFQKKGT